MRAPSSVLSHHSPETPHTPTRGLWREKTQFYPSRRAGWSCSDDKDPWDNLEDSKRDVAAFSATHTFSPVFLPFPFLNYPSIHSLSKKNFLTEKDYNSTLFYFIFTISL